jgi:nucleoredoxin
MEGEVVRRQPLLTGVDCGAVFRCPPCRGFTPLVATYKHLQAEGKPFEVVFVSFDRDPAAFREYLSSMPWLAVPFEDQQRVQALAGRFSANSIPTLVLLDADSGKEFTRDGRSAVSSDPKGDAFPWEGYAGSMCRLL